MPHNLRGESGLASRSVHTSPSGNQPPRASTAIASALSHDRQRAPSPHPTPVRPEAYSRAPAESLPGGRNWASNPVLVAFSALVITWPIYRPERDRRFDVLDFGEFLPILSGASNFWDQAAALIRYYASNQGALTSSSYSPSRSSGRRVSSPDT